MTDLYTSIMNRARGKTALYDLHPDLQYRYPVLRELSDVNTGLEQAGFKSNARFYTIQTWVHKAIHILATNISPLHIRVVVNDAGQITSLDDHPFSLLLASPNPEITGSGLWEEWVTDMMLGGEWGLEMIKAGNTIVEMYPRQSSDFSVLVNEKRKRYRTVMGYKIDDKQGESFEIPTDEFVHFKFYNPLNVWRGLAPIMAIRMGIIIDQLAQSWTSLFFKNNARPDYALIAPRGLTRSERDEYLNELTTDHGGGNVHRPIILEEGVIDIKTLSFPPKDMEWLAQREFSRDEVGAIFGVPDEIMGYGKDTWENFNTADRVLWTLTINPLVRMRDAQLTSWARKYNQIEKNQSIETDLSKIPQLQEDRTAKVNQYVSLVQNRIPPQMASDYVGLGLKDIPDGNTVYVSIAVIPAGQENTEETPPKEMFPVHKIKAPDFGSPEHESLWKRQQSRLDRVTEKMQRGLKRYFQDQQNEVLRKLRNSKDFGRGKWMKDPDRIPPINELYDYNRWIEEFKKRFGSDILAVIEMVGVNELQSLGIDFSFDLDDPDIRAGAMHILEEVAKKTNDTTWEELSDIFAEAEREGLGILAIQEMLSEYYGGRKSDWQTERIARTTMTGAANYGSIQAYDLSGVVKTKTWISAMIPDRSREEHMAAHNQTVGIHETFIVGGESLAYPGDPAGSAGNIINCLCTVIGNVEE